MTIKTHRLPLKLLLQIERATNHHYAHTVSKADPSFITMTNSEVERVLMDFLDIVEHKDMRWF